MMALAMPTATAKMIRSAIALFPSDESLSANKGGEANDDDQKKDHRALFEVIHVLSFV